MAKKSTTKIIAKTAKQDIIITREFDAPRELLFKAHTDTSLYGQWLGPAKFTVTFELFEPRNGGQWRYVFRQLDGPTLSFRGVYHEVKDPERIIGTFEFEGKGGYIILNATTFEALPGKRTKLIIQSVFQSVQDRDKELRFLTEDGLDELFVRLDALLNKMKQQAAK